MMKSNEELNHPLDRITQHDTSDTEPFETTSNGDPAGDGEDAALLPNDSPNLTPSLTQESALLLDDQLCVAWQNQSAITNIWHEAGTANNGSSSHSMFDMIFDPHFQRSVENWRRWAHFFIQQAHHMLPDEQLMAHIQERDNDQQEILKEMLQQPPAREDRSVYSGRMRQVLTDGHIVSFCVVATQFEQGRLIVFKPIAKGDETDQAYRATDIEQRFELLRNHGKPTPLPIHLLAARLNKAHTLRTEMLAEEYSRLMTRLYKLSIACIEGHGGMFHKLTGSGFLVLFLPDAQQSFHPLQAIECALELKGKMAELGREWKIRKGWLHDLELNMGLHWAQEHVSTVSSALGDDLVAYGNAQHTANLLSRLARNGQIWATKAVINQIAHNDQKKLRFGIFRQGHPHQVLINKSFLSIKDLISNTSITTEIIENELAGLAVTQVFDRHA